MKLPLPSSLLTLAPVLGVLGAATTTLPAHAQEVTHPFVSPMFSDNMVLQRGVSDPIWGWTTPGAKVTVRMGDREASATADAAGRWETKVGPFEAGGPYALTVSGPQSAKFENVLVGDVWVCSGQSNMEFGIGNIVDPAPTIAAANYPNIRIFTVTKTIASFPQDTLHGNWDVCTPETIAKGGWNGFSAVGYFFGRDLYEKLKIPVGLIHTSWGGTPAEAWTSLSGLKTVADYATVVKQLEGDAAERMMPGFKANMAVANWFATNDPGTSAKPAWSDPAIDASSWSSINAPGVWEQAGIPALAAFDGVVWYRKEVDIPIGAFTKPMTLHFVADDNDVTWVNGVRVGGTDGWIAPRAYPIPPNTIKPGKNVIVVRVLDTGGSGGIYGPPDSLKLTVADDADISLVGAWQYKIGVDLKQTTPYPAADNNPNAPTVLYNGMISPVLPYGIKGAIWYQGESNAGRAYQYRSLLPAMIHDWRRHWGEGDFPFYIVQLANFTAPPTEPGDSEWAELREAQSLAAHDVKNSGLAVAIDIGDAGDIHPKNKQDVGARLAAVALAKTYGEKIEYAGPEYKSMKTEGQTIRLRFDHSESGLVAKAGKLSGFAIAGDDKKFVWADAVIDSDSIVVSATTVAHPVAVRYAWATNPAGCNLYNGAGFPASPFRTDDWKGMTEGRK